MTGPHVTDSAPARPAEHDGSRDDEPRSRPSRAGHGLRALLVHVDVSPFTAPALAVAAALARSEHAGLHGVFAEPPEAMDLPYAHVAGGNALRAAHDAALMRRAQARAAFEAQAAGLPAGAHWSEVNGELPARTLALHAQCADLGVLAAPQADTRDGGVPLDFVETVLLASGRPLLLVPPRHHGPLVLDTAVVAWKPGAECARAVAGALPLLRQARRVVVASWAEAPLPTGGHADVAGWLLRHGIAADVQRHRHLPRDLPDTLHTLCRHEHAGLLVMGCYSHTRLRERVLGGATRALLQAMPLPVLMAH